MKPHRLVLAGFGAFAKRAEIDFDRLSEFGLYLIIGETGSGKTTLVNLVPRLFDATNGVVSLDGVDVRNLAPEALWSRVGIVPQKKRVSSRPGSGLHSCPL